MLRIAGTRFRIVENCLLSASRFFLGVNQSRISLALYLSLPWQFSEGRWKYGGRGSPKMVGGTPATPGQADAQAGRHPQDNCRGAIALLLPLIVASTRNHSWVIRRFLNRRW